MKEFFKNESMIAFLLILITSILGCRQQPMAEQGFEIPMATMPNRVATYDDVTFSPGGPVYRANSYEEGVVSNWQPVKSKWVAIGDSGNGPYAGYRDSIETKAGEIRYNIFTVRKSDDELVKFKITLADNISDIRVRNAGEWNGPVANGATVLMFEIPQNILPGNYKIEFFISVDGHNYDRIPCTIHVIE